jgi:hypothetical protein
MPQYSVDNRTVDNVLGFIKNKQISIPEIQRPFVWKGDQIRDLIDSLYNGYPIGYLIIWQNPDIIDKNGEKTIGKQIMIDGQQRITALMTSIVGLHVIDKDFKDRVYKIAFNPYAAAIGEPCFEVQSAAILKDKKWVKDISFLFSNNYNAFEFIPKFCEENPDMEPQKLNSLLERVREIKNVPIGVINLNKELSIDKVTEIFIRINSKGSSLTQADFVMSTIAADEQYGGNMLRKAIDYFCHLFSNHNFIQIIEKDQGFMASEYYSLVKWVKDSDANLFSLSFDDVLRIAFMSQYFRGKMANLTDLLHGRNFVTRSYENEIMEDSFERLTIGIKDVFNKYNFDQFIECLKGAGFISPRLIKGRMSLDFAYTLFLRLRKDSSIDKLKVPHFVQKWYVMSVITARYGSSPESTMDSDLRAIREKGFLQFYDEVMANIGDTFWNVTLVQKMETTASNSPVFNIFLAAQCKDVNSSFLSVGSKVRDLLDSADIHHIFPRQYLKDCQMDSTNIYNQIANYVYLTRPVNIAIGKKAPKVYLGEVVDSIKTGSESAYTTMKTMDELAANLKENCIPIEAIDMDANDYNTFLQKRRVLMAQKICAYYNAL